MSVAEDTMGAVADALEQHLAATGEAAAEIPGSLMSTLYAILEDGLERTREEMRGEIDQVRGELQDAKERESALKLRVQQEKARADSARKREETLALERDALKTAQTKIVVQLQDVRRILMHKAHVTTPTRVTAESCCWRLDKALDAAGAEYIR